MQRLSIITAITVLIIFTFNASAMPGGKPYCSFESVNVVKVIAYLGADTKWQLSPQQYQQLAIALQHVDVVNYAFVRFGKNTEGNTVIQLTADDINNLKTIRKARSEIPIILSIGGWEGRGSFESFLSSVQSRQAFVSALLKTLKYYQLDGIDVDWEDEQLSTADDREGLVELFHLLGQKLKMQGYCVTNAVPATSVYWNNYPSVIHWVDDVNWTTVMAYDHYGTFGPYTELSASLYSSDRSDEKANDYPYPTTSGNRAMLHYYQQGLPANKMIFGVPFYCHSYYVDNSAIDYQAKHPGLHVSVLDPNISSQVSYSDAVNQYHQQLFQYYLQLGQDGNYAKTVYGLIPLTGTKVTRFMSCDNPRAMRDKMNYVKGKNFLKQPLAGVSFWSLNQDLPYDNPFSLLKAINESLFR